MISRLTRNCFFRGFIKVLVLTGVVGLLCQAQAEPLLSSTIPTTGASGVSPSAAIVFTFNEAMDPTATTAFFSILSPFTVLTTADVWSSGNTVLTCTPDPVFPANQLIFWVVDGYNLNGDPLGGDPYGNFTTSGSGGTGSGTNALTSFSVGKVHSYNQTSTGTPVLDTDAPYALLAATTLASNRTANAVTLTLPGSGVSNLFHNSFQPESFTLFATMTNLTSFDTTFPAGNYIFTVQAATSNQQVTVNLSAGLAQPAAPHVNNFTAAQSVNPALPFQLGWDAFAGGTSADYISVNIGGVYRSPDLGVAGALNGTATSFLIPAGSLQSGSNYDVTIGFYRFLYTSNVTYTTTAYRATITQFNLLTTGGASSPLVLTNFGFTASTFNLEVTSAVGQTLTVEYKTNLLAGLWQTLLTTNSPGGRVRVTYPQASTNRTVFFRARTGS